MNRYLLTTLRAISFLFIIALLFGSETSAVTGNDGMLLLTENTSATKQNTQSSPLRLEMVETPTGITISVHYKEKQKQVPDKLLQRIPELISGGEIKLFIDHNLLTQTFFNTKEFDLDQPVNFELLENGDHTAECNINTASGEHFSKTIPFTIDASPRIKVTSHTNKKGVLDPEIKIRFFGTSDDIAGMLEIGIDAQPVQQIPVDIKVNNQQKPLSHFTQEGIDVARLSQGVHLLKIAAIGINGSRTVNYISFEVDTMPTVSLDRDKKGNFKKLSIGFPKSNQGFSGFLEVYLNHNMILARQVREDAATLTRGELKQALEKYNTSSEKHTKLTLIVAVRSANGVEKWTTIDFR